jgi:hypothetical protein
VDIDYWPMRAANLLISVPVSFPAELVSNFIEASKELKYVLRKQYSIVQNQVKNNIAHSEEATGFTW